VFDARVVEEGGSVVVEVSGEVDLAVVDALWDAIEQAASRSARLVLDLRDMTFIDSSGLGVLVRAHLKMGQVREAVVLRSPNAAARRILDISGIDNLVTIDGVDTSAPSDAPGASTARQTRTEANHA
jgi:anti-anti-sigma factor